MSSSRPSSRRQITAVTAAFALAAGVGIAAVIVPTLASPVGDPEALKPSTLGPNLIENSGFGKGLTSWSTSPDLGLADYGVWKSARSARLTLTNGRAASLTDTRESAPPSEAGRSYQASAFVRATAVPVEGHFRMAQWRGSSVVANHSEPFSAMVDRWSRVVFTATAESDGSDLVLSVTAPALKSGALLVDRVRLHAIKGSVTAEPSATVSDTPTPDPSPSDTPKPDPTTSSPTPDPTTSEPPVSGNGRTLFGASVQQGSRSWTTAVSESNQNYGGMEVVRVFYPGLPSKWPGRAGEVGGAVVVSFKAAPADILAGKYDATLSDWFRTAPTDRDIWWSYWHEPEDDVKAGSFTAQQWRDAYARIAALANAAGNPKLHNTVILMCWTLSPASGRNFADFLPGGGVVEALGWDCYAHSSSPYSDPDDLYAKAYQKTRDLGLQFGVAETGAKLGADDPTGAKRAAWLHEVGRWMLDHDATFTCYWDAQGTTGADYRLSDAASRQAWREVTTTYGHHDPV